MTATSRARGAYASESSGSSAWVVASLVSASRGAPSFQGSSQLEGSYASV